MSEKFLFKSHNAHLVNHLFQYLLIAYLVLLLIEQISPGFVSYYLNLNYLLIIVIIAGILDVFSEHPAIINKKPTKKDYLFIIVLGILGFFIIRYKTIELGWLSWLISSIAGILIILLSFLVLEDDEENENNSKSIGKSTNKPFKINLLLTIAIAIVLLLIISLALTYFTSLDNLSSLRIVFGSVYVLFLPGFILSFVFFPKSKAFDDDSDGMNKGLKNYNNRYEQDKASIDFIERIALSFALSIAIVPLCVFYLNLIGLKINLLNSFLTILGIIIISLIALFFRIKKSK